MRVKGEEDSGGAESERNIIICFSIVGSQTSFYVTENVSFLAAEQLLFIISAHGGNSLHCIIMRSSERMIKDDSTTVNWCVVLHHLILIQLRYVIFVFTSSQLKQKS